MLATYDRSLAGIRTVLFIAALLTAFLPWQYSQTLLQDQITANSWVGWRQPFGHFMLALIGASYLISVLDRRFQFDAVFFHRAFFLISVGSTAILHLSIVVRGQQALTTRWGFYVFVAVSCIYYAVVGTSRKDAIAAR